jgi:hypothetical protein
MSKHVWLAILVASMGGLSVAPEQGAGLSPEETEKALYAIGYLAVQRLPVGYHDFTREEVEVVLKGYTSVALRQPPEYEINEAVSKLDQMLGEQTESIRADLALRGDPMSPGSVLVSGVERLAIARADSGM